MMREYEEKAVGRIRIAHEMAAGRGNVLVVAYSGGKDSDVLLGLAKRSGVPFAVEHNLTTADAPQTVYHIREVFARLAADGISCLINRPRISMWDLIPKKKIPPMRRHRYCCAELKERRLAGQHLLFGVRWDESASRADRGLHENLHKDKEKRVVYTDENDDDRKLTEICQTKNRIVTNPIIDWSEDDVWRYATERKLCMNPLYAMGFHRVGCVGCPMALTRMRMKEFALFPKYKDMYMRAFARMLDARKETGAETSTWKTPKDVFDWWVDPKRIRGQTEMELDLYEG
jgi:phosphoadenosine phosphosulfate reductase